MFCNEDTQIFFSEINQNYHNLIPKETYNLPRF